LVGRAPILLKCAMQVFQELRMKGQQVHRQGGLTVLKSAVMKPAFLQELLNRRPEIAARWRTALKEAPVYTALGNPETMAFMITPTLNELFRMATDRPVPPWAPQSPPTLKLVESVSRCALNPMIGYYLAGESALTAIVRSVRPTDGLTETDILVSENELLALLRAMGRAEVTSFCEICLIQAPAAVAVKASAAIPAVCPFKTGEVGA
jgi:hypothetical protein